MKIIKFDNNLKICLIMFIIFFIFYLYFIAPTTWWGDSAEYSTMPHFLGVLHAPSYNIYLFVGKIFSLLPINDMGFRANLMSVFFAALTIPLLFLFILKLTKDKFSSIVGALSLAFSFTFWSQAVIAEVHTLNSFFVLLLLFLLFKWEKERSKKLLYIFTFLWAISLSVHISNILFAPAFIYFIATKDFELIKRNFPTLLILFLIGLSPFLWTIIRVSSFTPPPPMAKYYFGSSVYPNNVENFIKYITASEFDPLKPGFGFGELVERWFSYVKILQGNFLVIGVIVGIIGIWEMLKKNRKTAFLFILMFLANVIYFLNHPASDMFCLYFSSFLIFSIWIGSGVNNIKIYLNFPQNKILTLLMIFIIGFILFIVPYNLSKQSNLPIARLDYRGDYQTFDFSEKVFDTLENNSILISSWEEYAVLFYYQQLYNKRPDITLYDFEKEKEIIEFLDKVETDNKIYFTSQELLEIGIDNLKKKYNMIEIFRLDFNTTKNYRILYEIQRVD